MRTSRVIRPISLCVSSSSWKSVSERGSNWPLATGVYSGGSSSESGVLRFLCGSLVEPDADTPRDEVPWAVTVETAVVVLAGVGRGAPPDSRCTRMGVGASAAAACRWTTGAAGRALARAGACGVVLGVTTGGVVPEPELEPDPAVERSGTARPTGVLGATARRCTAGPEPEDEARRSGTATGVAGRGPAGEAAGVGAEVRARAGVRLRMGGPAAGPTAGAGLVLLAVGPAPEEMAVARCTAGALAAGARRGTAGRRWGGAACAGAGVPWIRVAGGGPGVRSGAVPWSAVAARWTTGGPATPELPGEVRPERGSAPGGGAERGAPRRGRCRGVGVVARWTGVGAGVAGDAEARGWPAGLAGAVGGAEGFGGAGVAEVTGGWVAGPGSAVVGPVVDTFPEVGAPRPRRRAGPEALRCTGRGPPPDCVLGGSGLVVGVVGVAGPPRLGPVAGEFAERAFPAWEPGATGLPGPGVRLSAWDVVTVVAAALSAGFPAAGPTGRVAGPPWPWSAVGRTGPGAVPAEPAVAGVADVSLELAVARWVLAAVLLERGAVALELAAAFPGPAAVPADAVGVLLELAVARWMLTAAPPELGAVAPELGAAFLGSVVVPADAVGVLLELVLARWVLAAVLPERGAVTSELAATAPLGPFAVPAAEVGVPLELVLARWVLAAPPPERGAVPAGLGAASPGPVALPAEAEAAGVLPEPLVARCTLAAVLPERVFVPPELGAASLGLVASPAAEVGVPPGAAGARWTPVPASPCRVAAPRGSSAVRLGPVAVRLGPSPALLELLVVPAGRVGMLPESSAALWTRTAALSVPAAVAAGPVVVAAGSDVVLPGLGVARWTLTTAFPGLVGVGPGPLAVPARSGAVPRGSVAARWTLLPALSGPVVVGVASGTAAAALLAVPAEEVAASVPTPAEPAALSAELAAAPPGRVAWAP